MAGKWNYSDAGLGLTKKYEGLRLDAYQDGGGVWTIGYGHTGPDVHPGMRITQEQADELLRLDVQSAVDCVCKAVTCSDLAQCQFDALVDFCYNVGGGNFRSSTLLRRLNAGDSAAAAAQFGQWALIKGVRSEGLARRREAERVMFASGAAS